MNFSEFLLDETIKRYAKDHKGFGGKALNITRIAKAAGLGSALVWRQINKKGAITAESFWRLMSAMKNCEYDKERASIVIKVDDVPENHAIIERFSNGHFKTREGVDD